MTPSAEMAGRICVITGANSGIGKETAVALASQGAQVVMVCRDAARGEAALADVTTRSESAAVELMLADLSSQQAIRELAARLKGRLPALHVLVNNAGIINPARELTADGHEKTFAVNHLAYFLLTQLLLDLLKASAPSRVINVASAAHTRGKIDFEDLHEQKSYSALRAYSQSKLANVLFTTELAKRLEGTGVVANAVHPGVVDTGWGATARGPLRWGMSLIRPLMKTPKQGAATSIYLASSPDMARTSGQYFVNSKPAKTARAAKDSAVAARLWQVSEKLTGLA